MHVSLWRCIMRAIPRNKCSSSDPISILLKSVRPSMRVNMESALPTQPAHMHLHWNGIRDSFFLSSIHNFPIWPGPRFFHISTVCEPHVRVSASGYINKRVIAMWSRLLLTHGCSRCTRTQSISRHASICVFSMHHSRNAYAYQWHTDKFYSDFPVRALKL